jgi:thioredoxin reductase (NADPH)
MIGIPESDPVDLLIVGGGPAGLASAINGASEGLKVRIMDNGNSLGGQARESSAIENYPGFPDSITGLDLMGRFVEQANKFGTGFFCPCHGAVLRPGVGDEPHVVISDDYQEHRARAVMLSLGVNYKRLNAENISQFIGRGVFYGVPSWGSVGKARTVGVIGGANSAGQAVVALAKHRRTKVRMFVRRNLEVSMSAYLIDKIRNLDNVEVLENCELVSCQGTGALREISYNCNGTIYTCPLDALHIFIGAIPKTMWVEEKVQLDPARFVVTGNAALPYETSVPGVFAAGDVRSGSTKRIATAIGEGVNALQSVHKYLGG